MKILYGISILAGTIIGAGIFSLPYITSVVGIQIMIGYLFILGGVAIIVHYFLGEVSLKTPDFLRLPGFAKHHLGEKAEKVAYVSGILGMLGAVLAYLILGGEFLRALLSPLFGGEMIHYLIIYFVVSALFIYFGIKAISRVEFWGIIFFFVALVVVFVKEFSHISLENIFLTREASFDFFLPYGAVLFALWGGALIPEIEELLGRQKEKLRLVIPLGLVVAILISLFFIVIILGITGEDTTKEALVGLQAYLGRGVTTLMLVFGLVATFTSLVAIGLTLKKIFWYDLKISHKFSWGITCFVPLLLFLGGARDFIVVIGIVGGVMIAVDAILISLMYEKIKTKRVRLITFPLIILFLLGILYEIVYFIE